MNSLSFALCSTFVVLAGAAYYEPGPCPPKPPFITPFDIERYSGDWYTVWTTHVTYAPEGETCLRAQYGSFDQGVNNISVYNSGIRPDGTFSDVCAWGQPVDPLNPTGELDVYFSGASEALPYWALDTDYDNFVSGYSCQNITLDHPPCDDCPEVWNVHKQSAFILTRVRNPSQETVDMAFEVFERNGLIFDDWYPIPQFDDCVNDVTPSCKDEWP